MSATAAICTSSKRANVRTCRRAMTPAWITPIRARLIPASWRSTDRGWRHRDVASSPGLTGGPGTATTEPMQERAWMVGDHSVDPEGQDKLHVLRPVDRPHMYLSSGSLHPAEIGR